MTSEAELAPTVVADLAKVGVAVNSSRPSTTPPSPATSPSTILTRLWIGSNANNTADADYNLTTNVYSKGRGPDRDGYYIPTEPKDIDDAILQGRKIVDEKQRLAHYQKLYQQIVDLAPMVFWFDLADSYGVSKRLTWKPRADEVMSLRNASVAS